MPYRFLPFSILMIISLQLSAGKFIGKSAFSPDIVINTKLSDKFTINTKIESFHYFFDRDNTDQPFQRYYDGTDFQLFLTRSINPYRRVSLGYQYGLEPGTSGYHRFIQQYTWITRTETLVLGHRLRTDQSFYRDAPFRWRVRYRLAFELPLQGLTLDPGEFYLLSSGELLFSSRDKTEDLESRLVFQGGFLVIPGQKLQLGIDLRSRLSDNFLGNNILLKVSWGININ